MSRRPPKVTPSPEEPVLTRGARHRYFAGISVEVHSDRFKDGAADITERVRSFRVSQQLTRPWETLSAVFAFEYGLNNVRSPQAGDWIVLRAASARAKDDPAQASFFFGYVTNASSSFTVDAAGAKELHNVSVTAVSWFEILGRTQVFVALTAKQTVGTLFAREAVSPTTGEQIRSWNELINALIGAISPNSPAAIGESLAEAWVSLASIILPKTLAPGDEAVSTTLGDLVPVVYDESSRAQYAPRMVIDPVPGWSLQGLKSLMPKGQSVLDVLMGTYMADQNMVELFPTLEPFDQAAPIEPVRVGTTAVSSQADADRQAAAHAGPIVTALRGILREAIDVAGLGASPMAVGTPASALGRVLGMNPVITYRVKPWRPQELVAYRDSPYTPRSSKKQPLNLSIFRGITWDVRQGPDLQHGFTYSRNEITDWRGSFDDGEHVNCVSMSLPDQPDNPIRWLDDAGLPIVADKSVQRFGLRHFQPRWPFWPPLDDNTDDAAPPTKDSLLSSLYTTALQAMQFMGNADRFLRGTVTLTKMRPELRPGMSAEFDLADLAPGGARMLCYVDSVTHTLSVGAGGEITARTTVNYSRGALDRGLYTRQFLREGASPADPDDGPRIESDTEATR